MNPLELLKKYTAGNLPLYQILYGHSRAVADLALRIAGQRDISVDEEFVEQAALLHDIGIVGVDAPSIKCYGAKPYICHGVEGARILRAEGLPGHALVAERHTGSGISKRQVVEQNLPLPVKDYIPQSMEEKLICYADKFYSKSRDLTAAKPLDKIRMQMQAHGPESAERFAELEAIFGNPFE